MLKPNAALALFVLTLVPSVAARDGVLSTATAPFPNFESGPVRPLLLSDDGLTLYALNTPDHRVEIYSTGADAADGVPRLEYEGAIFTGLEPVSMAIDPLDTDVLFVANLVSDTVSVIRLSERRVVATIDVGDEPQDLLVTAGKLVVACARSPQNPDLLTPSGFLENVIVIANAAPPYQVLDRLPIEGHKPRALANVGYTVYAIPVNSGNHTTTLGEVEAQQLGVDQMDLDAFDDPFPVNGALLNPKLQQGAFNNHPFGINGWEVPATARIVMDSEYPGTVPQLEDRDVHLINAQANVVRPEFATGVGTTLLGIARNPGNNDLWVVNTDAKNRRRFEPRIRGAAMENRVTIVGLDGAVKDIIELAPPFTSRHHAQPTTVVFSSGPAGNTAYVAALGTSTVVAIDADTGSLVQEISTAEMPLGLAVDDDRSLLYVFTRGDKTIRAYDIAGGHVPTGRPRTLAYDPEPAAVAAGRIHLYDARTSTGAGTGNFSCASCHIFGHGDSLAWDLGDPEGGIGYFFPDIMRGVLGFGGVNLATKVVSMTHPMKGPMVTQSLRGLSDAAGPPLHWRGDRRFFQMFRGAFRGLLGGTGISALAMQEYTAFIRSMVYPPNPFQPRDREYRGMAAEGRDLFGMNPDVPGKEYNPLIPGTVTCIDCHKGNFAAETNFTGSQRTVNFDGPSQLFNTPTLRGGYEKEARHLTGFGILHDGSIDDVREFLAANLGGIAAFPLLTAANRNRLAVFLREWDTGFSPLVGGQHTASKDDLAGLASFLDLAEEQASPPLHNVDLIAKAHLLLPGGGRSERGFVWKHDPAKDEYAYETDTGRFRSRDDLVALLAAGKLEITFTAVPPGLGTRLGVDRDEDGVLDGTERFLGTRPWSPDSDDDGFSDGLEISLGGHPRIPDALLAGDGQAPSIVDWEVRDVFTGAATLHVELDEPGTLLVEVGTGPGVFDLASFGDDGLRQVHDLHLVDLPAGSTLHFKISASDRNGNVGTLEDSFDSGCPLYRVQDITLDSAFDGGTGEYTLTATVLVLDHTDAPVVDIPVKGMWAGDIGNENFFPPLQRTDADGIATFVLGPYVPAGPTTVTFSPAFVGTTVSSDPFYIGAGGDEPTFFYDQSSNAINYRSIDLP